MMKLQIDLLSQQRNHRLSRAAWLQCRWLEVSEQERRAQLHNQKLLQDFQRAQDTLDDMVVRTEAMNTIRVQYERYLEENYPRWQQKLKDMRVSDQSKQVQKHLRNHAQQMEEDQGIKAQHRSESTVHPLSSNFPHLSQLPTCHTLPMTHQSDKDTRQNAARCSQNDHAYLPSTWLTGPQPVISGLPQNNILKDYKNIHNIQALSPHLPPCYSLPLPHSPVQQKSSSINHMYQNPLADIRHTGQFTPTGASWPQLPVLNPMAWGMMDVPYPGVERTHCSETGQENTTKEMLKPSEESNQRLKHKRKGRDRDQSSELDCRPVRLLIDDEDSSDGSAVSSEVVEVPVFRLKERRKKRRDRTESQSTVNGRKSQSSSTVSQDAYPKKSKKLQKPSTAEEQDNSKKATITHTDTNVVKQNKEDDEQEESRSQEITPRIAGSDKSDGTELNERNSGEEDTDEGENSHDLFEEKKISERKGIDEGDEEKEGGRDDEEEEAELDDKEGSDGNRDETDHSDGEESEGEEDVTDNIPDSDGEEEADKPEREINKNSSQDELVKEVRGTGGGTFKIARKDANESEAESDDNVDISERKVTNNSLKELYGDDETDDDDEIVVEQAYPWTKDCLYEQTKSNDDDNEDIEDLLNPHVNSQTQQEDAVETDQSKDLLSDSEDLPKKSFPAATNKPAESDDEFDHFYD
ncbi:protein starmaker isoform X2 [Triplophysa rosa]|uniref:protein starmaker isoform X2 n=1 Tax=Triplophysa rosa TaxID=992332 RepID=UPI002545CDA5|nr:protein starmaker isoform X2 [Triplophysa rosa]